MEMRKTSWQRDIIQQVHIYYFQLINIREYWEKKKKVSKAYVLVKSKLQHATPPPHPPSPGVPRAFHTFAVPGRREFAYQSLPGGGEFELHPRFHVKSLTWSESGFECMNVISCVYNEIQCLYRRNLPHICQFMIRWAMMHVSEMVMI